MTVIDLHRATLSVASHVLQIKSGSVALDEAWSPYCQLTAVCILPDDDVLDDIDPRIAGVRVRAAVEQVFGEGGDLADYSAEFPTGKLSTLTAWLAGRSLLSLSTRFVRPWNGFGLRSGTSRSFDLTLRGRVIDHAERTLTITASSDEQIAQDFPLVTTTPFTPGYTSVLAIVQDALARIGAVLAPGAADATVEAKASDWLPGVTVWDHTQPVVQQAGLRLWCDERRVWRLETAGKVVAGQLQLKPTTPESSGTLTRLEDSITRDGGWYDAVVISYEWIDALGATQRAYDVAAEANYTKALVLEYKTAYPGPGAARRVLDRRLGRGRVLDIGAVSDYRATPGMATTVTPPDAPAQTGFISSVEWTFGDKEMHVGTRGLVDTPPAAWDYLAAGQRWIDSPAGASWTSEPIGA